MSAGKRVHYDSFTVNVFVGEKYLADTVDGLPQAKADAVEDIIETAKSAFVANLSSRISAVVGPDVGVTITEL